MDKKCVCVFVCVCVCERERERERDCCSFLSLRKDFTVKLKKAPGSLGRRSGKGKEVQMTGAGNQMIGLPLIVSGMRSETICS